MNENVNTPFKCEVCIVYKITWTFRQQILNRLSTYYKLIYGKMNTFAFGQYFWMKDTHLILLLCCLCLVLFNKFKFQCVYCFWVVWKGKIMRSSLSDDWLQWKKIAFHTLHFSTCLQYFDDYYKHWPIDNIFDFGSVMEWTNNENNNNAHKNWNILVGWLCRHAIDLTILNLWLLCLQNGENIWTNCVCWCRFEYDAKKKCMNTLAVQQQQQQTTMTKSMTTWLHLSVLGAFANNMQYA